MDATILLFLIITAILAIALCACVFLLLHGRRYRKHEKYEAFRIDGDKILILAGVPKTFSIDTIEKIIFSNRTAPRSLSYYGTLQVLLKNGNRSRLFQFRGDVYFKKPRYYGYTQEEIDQTIAMLMNELEKHAIPCSMEQ
ncbi:hypothetical protein [Bacteroides heparinolyticus]|uniref:hypothetical protein n=1 Tax=Prevotella heparinolytica TaxID=28113 RepID=UPI0035A18FA6